MTTLISTVAPISASSVGAYALRSLIIVVFLIAAFRLLGKREMATLNVYDLAMLMAVSNAVQNAMTGGRGNLAVGLATSSTVILAAWIVTRVLIRDPVLERRIIGSPTLLVHNGVLLEERCRSNRISQGEVEAACRERGVGDFSEVRSLVLEVDGTMTVIPRERETPESHHDATN